VTGAIVDALRRTWRPIASVAASGAAAGGSAAVAGSSVSLAKADPFGYLGYLWQVFLPRLPSMARHFETSVPPAFLIYVERGWGAFGWYDVLFPRWLFLTIFAVMMLVLALAPVAAFTERAWLRRHWREALVIVLCPISVVAAVEAAFYTPGSRAAVAEFGRYAFPAIVPLSLILVGSLHAFGRRSALLAGTVLLTAMIALSVGGQLRELTGFYA
jgi:hypothetical protein